MTTRVQVRESSIHGAGVFAQKDIRKGEVIGIITGMIPEVVDDFSPYTLSFEEEHGTWYLEPAAPFKYLNHSPDPNAEWGTPVLVAARDISRGEEITIYYSDDYEEERKEYEASRSGGSASGDRRDDSQSRRSCEGSGGEGGEAPGRGVQETQREGSSGENLGGLVSFGEHSNERRVSDATQGAREQAEDASSHGESQADGHYEGN